jgi:hypothetical protein
MLTESTEKKIAEDNLFYVATTNPPELKNLLEKSRSKSAVIFFFGNETYNIPQIQWLNEYSSKIKFAFIYNLPRKTPIKIAIRCLIGAIADGGLLLWNRERNIFRNFKNGIDLLRRTRNLTLEFSCLDFPQGYSRRFVTEVKLSGINIGEGSILDKAPLGSSHKRKRFSFVGQNGSWCRELAIKVLTKKNIGFIPTYTQGWAGANQGTLTSYVDSLIHSEVTLNPPGNLTNRTHRYLESLIFNSLPIMPPSTLQDPHLWGVWSENCNTMHFSWKLQINNALKFSLQDRENLISKALMKEKETVQKINIILNKIDKSIKYTNLRAK